MSEQTRHKVGPLVLLLLLLTVQCFVVIFSTWPPKFQGDETYYVTKAFYKPLISDSHRPQGYQLFIALCNLANDRAGNVRYRCAVVQLLLAIGVILFFYRIASRALGSSPRLYFVAFLLGIQPWVFDSTRRLYPDSLTASLLTFGLLGLFAFIRAAKPGSAFGFFFLSTLLLCATILLRPEMIVLTPVFLFVALVLKWRERVPLWIAMTLSLLFVASAGFLSGYHLILKGKVGVFGKFSLTKPGALNWVQTWFATERMGFKNFLNGPYMNRSKFDHLPDRAFSDEYERSEIRRACELSEQRRKYDQDVDDIFRKVAEKRKQEHFFRHSLLAKIWAMAQIWLNLVASEQWFRLVPHNGFLFLLMVLFFFSLKLLVFSLAALSVLQVFRYQREKKLRWYHTLTILMILCVVIRTLLMGGMIGYLHRYAIPAWPAMLWCAVSGCIDFPSGLFAKIVRK
ncbi:hypothetical protein L0156_05000 [bacterium]|nr:hypothetical protein [bacterium]